MDGDLRLFAAIAVLWEVCAWRRGAAEPNLAAHTEHPPVHPAPV